MKVLFVAYPHVGLGKGGMINQILQTKKFLIEAGVDVIEHKFSMNNLEDIDICHVWGTHSSCHHIIKYCHGKNIPVVMSTVYGRNDVSLRYLKIESFVSKNARGFLTEIRSFHSISHMVDKYIFLSAREQERFESSFGEVGQRGLIIQNGVDTDMLPSVPLNKTKNTVLNVGIVSRNKNQLNLIKAAVGSHWELILVGPNQNDDYWSRCIELASGNDNIKLMGSVEYGSTHMKELYAEASVFCLPSLSEVQPLVLLEAASFNCNLVASSNIPVQDFLIDSVIFCNSSSISSLKSSIEKALLRKHNTWEKVKSQDTWKDVASQVLAVYYDSI